MKRADGVGRMGWTAMPRTAAWLCLPALLMGASATAMLAGGLVLAGDGAWRDPLYQAAAAVIVVWAFPALALTPAAGILILVISRKRKWTPRVVTVLWILLVVSAAVVVPATNLALRNYRFFPPLPAEAPWTGGGPAK